MNKLASEYFDELISFFVFLIIFPVWEISSEAVSVRFQFESLEWKRKLEEEEEEEKEEKEPSLFSLLVHFILLLMIP